MKKKNTGEFNLKEYLVNADDDLKFELIKVFLNEKYKHRGTFYRSAKDWINYKSYINISEALSNGFYWVNTPQGLSYWYNLSKKYEESL